MKIKSVKAKGRALQNYVRDMLRDTFSKLEPDDIKSQTMGMTGDDIVLSPRAQKEIPFSFECKNVERLQIWSAIDQCKANAGDRIPAIVFKKNRRNPYVAIPLGSFCDIIGKWREDEKKNNQEG